MTDRREELVNLTNAFMDAFNREDLDGVMSFFHPDAVYDEMRDRQHHGLAAIRAAFEPQFTGAFGPVRFIDEDLFVDPEAGKVMASWRVTLEVENEPTAYRGLDLLHFQGDKIARKLTYAKVKVPRFES